MLPDDQNKICRRSAVSAYPVKTKICYHDNHTQTPNPHQALAKREKKNQKMSGKVILPDMGDSTMFPDL